MSGLQIFNAHPALYLGAKSNFDDPILAMQPMMHDDKVYGVTTLFGWQFDTTGVFGLAGDAESGYDDRGFPWWATLPGHRDLSMGRRWHFFFAWLFLFNGLTYLLWSLGSGHLRRDLAPTAKDLKHIGASIAEHARLKFPKGDEAKRYNVLQKLSYLIVALVLLLLIAATGCSQSDAQSSAPPKDAAKAAPGVIVSTTSRRTVAPFAFFASSICSQMAIFCPTCTRRAMYPSAAWCGMPAMGTDCRAVSVIDSRRAPSSASSANSS